MRGDTQVVSSAGVVANLVVTPTLIFALFDVATSLIEFLLPEHITMKAEPLDQSGPFIWQVMSSDFLTLLLLSPRARDSGHESRCCWRRCP
jgi:hypothetical protein